MSTLQGDMDSPSYYDGSTNSTPFGYYQKLLLNDRSFLILFINKLAEISFHEDTHSLIVLALRPPPPHFPN